jgi:transposase-like protein
LGQRRAKADQDAPAAQVYLEVLENVRTATIKPLIVAKVKGGSQCFTDEDTISHVTKADYDHRTVNHGAGAYARRDPDGTCVHCHTLEGMWSGLGHVLDRFKGISQRCLPLRVGRYEFLHNHAHLNGYQSFETALRYMCSTTGDYLRQMTHQHRRMLLTLLPRSVERMGGSRLGCARTRRSAPEKGRGSAARRPWDWTRAAGRGMVGLQRALRAHRLGESG